jgi:hypothetical protein
VGEARDRRGLAGFGRAFGQAWGAVLGATFGFALMMAGVATPFDESEAWWEWLISIPLGLVVVVFGCGIVVLSAGGIAERVASGYWGMMLGTCPAQEYGPRPGNLEQALASGLFALSALGLGVALFRVGAREGELNWTLEGLLLCFAGTALGLGALIPRLYFWRLPPRGSERPKIRELELPGIWLIFVVAVTLGIGLSFGVCNGFAESKARAERERAKSTSDGIGGSK